LPPVPVPTQPPRFAVFTIAILQIPTKKKLYLRCICVFAWYLTVVLSAVSSSNVSSPHWWQVSASSHSQTVRIQVRVYVLIAIIPHATNSLNNTSSQSPLLMLVSQVKLSSPPANPSPAPSASASTSPPASTAPSSASAPSAASVRPSGREVLLSSASPNYTVTSSYYASTYGTSILSPSPFSFTIANHSSNIRFSFQVYLYFHLLVLG
jgi:hypothetical protein